MDVLRYVDGQMDVGNLSENRRERDEENLSENRRERAEENQSENRRERDCLDVDDEMGVPMEAGDQKDATGVSKD